MKKILLTAVGYNDPYTNNGKYNDGSLLHIIRNYHTDGNPIEEIYAYFSFDMAIEESKTHALEIAVGEIEGKHKININYFPRGIIEKVSKKREEIRKNLLANNYQGKDLDKEVEIELNKITDIGRIDVNKFGSFYPEIQVMLSDIEKKPNIKDYEILVNVTSGTPAMKEDLNLMSITNKNSNLKLKMIQVAIPGISKSERRSYPYTNNLSPLEIKEDINRVNTEEQNNNRTSEEKMTNIKKLLLLESIEHLFAKYDYAGVYEATSNAYKENYLENVQINLYAKNLYYRYIGNAEIALAASNNFSSKKIELYPIKDKKVGNHFKNINTNYGLLIENYNILQVKAKRLEINDWLLLAQTIIEDLYKKLLYKITDGFDIDNIIVDHINPSLDKFNELYSDYDYLKPIIFIQDRKGFGAGALKVVLSKTLKLNNELNLIPRKDQQELVNTINVLDMIRTYRNTSAHTIGFVTKEILKDGIKEKIEDLKNKKHICITLKNPNDMVEETHYHIKKLIDYCIDDENRSKLEDTYNLYQNIKEQIITLLKAEITERGNSEVIAIYDVRGIQDYIFRTNVLKEIVGASSIVDKLVLKEFENAVKDKYNDPSKYVIDVQNKDELKFEDDTNIEVELLYYGGGNLVVLYRDEQIYEEISKKMSLEISKKAYGLSLSHACASKTDNYKEDWKTLKDKLANVKAITPLNKPAGIVPIVQYDNVTGLPLSKKDSDTNRRVTYESHQKLSEYKKINKDENQEITFMKNFDEMRTSENEGLIAIVHIDGNSMGNNIAQIMKEVTDYKEAVRRMRKISNDIHEVFEEKAIDRVKDSLKDICRRHGIKVFDNAYPFRPLIQAGDDITFVCNERISLDVSMEFIKEIRKGYMYEEKYPFSACGGIAIIHSHFPFYKGYNLAEECCSKAKERAKSDNYKIDGRIGNYLDFCYCYSGVIIDDIDELRKENYTSIENKSLIRRPYAIYSEEEKKKANSLQKEVDIDTFIDTINKIKNISRSSAKKLRDLYYQSQADVELEIKRLRSKNKDFPLEVDAFYEDNVAKYYDALEFLDIYKEEVK